MYIRISHRFENIARKKQNKMIIRFDILVSAKIVIFATICICNSSAVQTNHMPSIPCPNVFLYSRSGNKSIGLLQVNNVTYGQTIVAVEISQEKVINANNNGKLSLNFNRDKVFEHIEEGGNFTFRVDFPDENVIPKVTSITVNGIKICSGPKDTSPITSTMSLEYTLRAFKSNSTSLEEVQGSTDFRLNIWSNYIPIPVPVPDDGSPPNTTTAKPSTHRATFAYIDSVCGRENVNFDIKKLNIKGTVISKSRFPWIVAIFSKIDGDVKFRCGGSLISTRTVISAAHCFHLGFEEIKREQIVISLGRHNLTDPSDSHNIDVERIIIHPDYNPTLTNFDADLALVRLTQSVIFTTSIRPICLWQGPLDVRDIEGISGAIVGWGANERNNISTVPTLVTATIVSQITCIRSDDQFYSLTSKRTLCAGNLDGSGPCMGDSGNGLMIRNRNKWMLRGTVSATIGTPVRPCILDQYAIYSDIATFIEWIRGNMLL